MVGWDQDGWLNADDLIANVVWKKTYYWASSTWYTSRYTYSHGSYYEIKIRFTCNSNYYGSRCTVYCKAQNNYWNGHYTCSSSGSKICNSGWTGTNCKYGKYTVYFNCIFVYSYYPIDYPIFAIK